MADKPSRVLGPDGLQRSKAKEDELNDLAVAVFGRGAGKEFLSYLRAITIEMVAGPEISDTHLRHREGMRSLVAIIETRLAAGQERRRKSNVESAG